jgi:hypothetical protein
MFSAGELDLHKPVVDVFNSIFEEDDFDDFVDEAEDEREALDDEIGSLTGPLFSNEAASAFAKLNFILNLRLNFMQEKVIFSTTLFYIY